MYLVEKYLEQRATDDPAELAKLPGLAACALLEISATQQLAPKRIKKGLPIFRHTIPAKDAKFRPDGGQFDIDVRARVEIPALYENPGYYAKQVASMMYDAWPYQASYEFSPEGHTSLAQTSNSSSSTEQGMWQIANLWTPVEPSVRRYVRITAEGGIA